MLSLSSFGFPARAVSVDRQFARGRHTGDHPFRHQALWPVCELRSTRRAPHNGRGGREAGRRHTALNVRFRGRSMGPCAYQLCHPKCTDDEDRRAMRSMRYARLSAEVDEGGYPCPGQDACALRYSRRIFCQQMAQVTFAEHHDMVEALASDRSDPREVPARQVCFLLVPPHAEYDAADQESLAQIAKAQLVAVARAPRAR